MSASSSKSGFTRERCDVCNFKDGWEGLRCDKCDQCGVVVHRECYFGDWDGADSLREAKGSKERNLRLFTCWACQAIGKDIQGAFQIRGRHDRDKLVSVTQVGRPRSCVLCNVQTGTHAMHPLYHTYGSRGRQMVISKDGKKELAWVHSICALAICVNRRTAGCVYGCNEKGIFEGMGVEQLEDELEAEEDENDVPSLHHFCICLEDEEELNWYRIIREHRKELKCILCGADDSKSLRIPLQCSAGDEDEHRDFRGKHKNLRDSCTQAMHVGCAMWGNRLKNSDSRMVYFFPGVERKENEKEKEEEPVIEIYCHLHAGEVNPKKRSQADKKGTPKNQRSHTTGRVQEGRLRNIAQKPDICPAASRKTASMTLDKKRRLSDPLTSLKKKIGGSMGPSVSGGTHSFSRHNSIYESVDETVSRKLGNRTGERRSSATSLPSARRPSDPPTKPLGGGASDGKAPPSERQPSSSGSSSFVTLSLDPRRSSTHRTQSKQQTTPLASLSKLTSNKIPPRRKSTTATPLPEDRTSPDSGFEPANDVTFTDISKPSLLRRRSSISEEKTDNNLQGRDLYDEIVQDVQVVIALSKERKYDDADELIRARRSFWRKKSDLVLDDFKVLWKRVQDSVGHADTGRQDDGEESDSPHLADHVMVETIDSDHLESNIDDNDGSNSSENNEQTMTKNRWSHLWGESADFFKMDEWDSS